MERKGGGKEGDGRGWRRESTAGAGGGTERVEGRRGHREDGRTEGDRERPASPRSERGTEEIQPRSPQLGGGSGDQGPGDRPDERGPGLRGQGRGHDDGETRAGPGRSARRTGTRASGTRTGRPGPRPGPGPGPGREGQGHRVPSARPAACSAAHLPAPTPPARDGPRLIYPAKNSLRNRLPIRTGRSSNSANGEGGDGEARSRQAGPR